MLYIHMPISLYRAYDPMWTNASSLVLLLLFEAFRQHFTEGVTEGLCCNTTTSNKSYHFQLQSQDYQVRLCTQFAHEGLAVDLGSSDLMLEFCSVCLCAALSLLCSSFILDLFFCSLWRGLYKECGELPAMCSWTRKARGPLAATTITALHLYWASVT